MGLPDLRSKKKGKQKVSKESHVSEALDQLREQTREAVKGLESVPGAKPAGGDPMMEDWVKQFEELAGSQVFYASIFFLYFFLIRFNLFFSIEFSGFCSNFQALWLTV